MIISHMFDQPYWGRRVYELGVGVKPLPHHQVTAQKLADGLRQLLADRSLAASAERLGEQIRAEEGVEKAVATIHRFVEKKGVGRSTVQPPLRQLAG
jgi:sterol 3beta-glucosyltransferase